MPLLDWIKLDAPRAELEVLRTIAVLVVIGAKNMSNGEWSPSCLGERVLCRVWTDKTRPAGQSPVTDSNCLAAFQSELFCLTAIFFSRL